MLKREIKKYLDMPATRELLGVSPTLANKPFEIAAMDVNQLFANSGDEYGRSTLYVAALLERGVRVLVYVGENDWICNWVGNEKWVLGLKWSGSEEMRKSEARIWDGGRVQSFGGLTFATVEGAGHMVCYSCFSRCSL